MFTDTARAYTRTTAQAATHGAAFRVGLRSTSGRGCKRVWTFDLTQLAAQSTNPDGACYLAPPVVPPEVAPALPPPAVLEIVVQASVVVATQQAAELAFTGAESFPLTMSGMTALVLGAGLTVMSRRRVSRAQR